MLERTGKRLWVFRLTVLAAAIGVSLLMAELVMRASDGYRSPQPNAGHAADTPPFEFCPTRHHRLIPNVRHTHQDPEFDYVWVNNSIGMRDRERSAQKDPKSFRIFFLGDSFVQGYGVPLEQTMVARLETSLNKPARQKRIEVLNGGVFGYSPFLEYLYLKEVMAAISPDCVIVGFFLGNDVGDDYFYTRQRRENPVDGSVRFEDKRWPWSYLNEKVGLTANGEVPQTQVKGGHGAWNIRSRFEHLLLKSRLAAKLKQVLDQHRRDRQYGEILKRRRDFAQGNKNDIRINMGMVNYPVGDQQERLAYWAISKRYLGYIEGLCRTRGIPMVLVVIPDTNAFSETEFHEPYHVLDQIGRDLSIPVIHLLPAFLEQQGEELFYEVDGHWNRKGHGLAAKILDQEFKELDLLPPEKGS